MLLSIIRHGETAHNRNRVMQGHGEVPLSDLGIQQVYQAAKALAGNSPDYIYCSDLRRALMSGTVIAAVTGAPMVLDPAFRERDPGALTGRPYEEALPFFNDPAYAPPQGETFAAFTSRIEAAFERLIQGSSPHHAHVAVVTHGMIPMAIMSFAFGKSAADCLAMTIPNASITTLRYDGQWHLESFALATHLEDQTDSLAGG